MDYLATSLVCIFKIFKVALVLCFNSLRYDYFIIIINFNEWFPSEINKGTENLGVIQTLPTGALLTGRRKAQHFTADFMGGGVLIVFICQK